MIKLPIKYTLGNVFHKAHVEDNYYFAKHYIKTEDTEEEFFFVGSGWEDLRYSRNEAQRSLKLVGITPTCLAEIARKKRHKVTLGENDDGWVIQAHKIPRKFDFPNFTRFQEPDESLEEFCLRVAKERKYLN